MGSKHEKVGDDSTAEAMRVIQPNQVTQKWNILRTSQKSHFHGRWSHSGGARWCAGAGANFEISEIFITAFVPDVRITTSKFSFFKNF